VAGRKLLRSWRLQGGTGPPAEAPQPLAFVGRDSGLSYRAQYGAGAAALRGGHAGASPQYIYPWIFDGLCFLVGRGISRTATRVNRVFL